MLKRIKRLLRKRNNGGFTLVEVIIATALLSILMLGMFGFIQPVMKSVKKKEQNARAVMLAEAVESYIFNTTKYAYYVATFSGVVRDDLKVSGGSAAPIVNAEYKSDWTALVDPNIEDEVEAEAQAKELDRVLLRSKGTLKQMQERRKKLNESTYEIRCIGIRWLPDPESGDMKLMLTNEVVVNQDTLALDLTKSKLVFEPCFYDGLNPVVYFKNYTNQYQVLDPATGLPVNKYSDADVLVAPGLEITMDVYLDAECYSTDESVRSNAVKAFTGTTFANYRNMVASKDNPKGEKYKVLPNAQIRTYDSARAQSSTLVYDNPEVGDTYYPDTFIYYLARKRTTTTTPTT